MTLCTATFFFCWYYSQEVLCAVSINYLKVSPVEFNINIVTQPCERDKDTMCSITNSSTICVDSETSEAVN